MGLCAYFPKVRPCQTVTCIGYYSKLHGISSNAEVLLAEIQFIEEPEDATVHEGGDATFICDYSGTSNYPTWNIDNVPYLVTELPSGHSYDRQTLRVSNVQLSDNGRQYQCDLFRIRSRIATLYVIPNQGN